MPPTSFGEAVKPDQLRRLQASGPRFGLAPKAEKENGPAIRSPRPTQAGYWCSRQERAATGCEFEAGSATSRVMQMGSDLGYVSGDDRRVTMYYLI